METRRGLLTKLGAFSVVSVGLVVVGRQHIAALKDARHMEESAQAQRDGEFLDTSTRRGFPNNNPNFNYESNARESKYVGSGVAYSTRTKGDRLSIWNIWRAKGLSDEHK